MVKRHQSSFTDVYKVTRIKCTESLKKSIKQFLSSTFPQGLHHSQGRRSWGCSLLTLQPALISSFIHWDMETAAEEHKMSLFILWGLKQIPRDATAAAAKTGVKILV